MPAPMITALADKPADYDFLASAERQHAIAGYDFPTIFDYYFKHQWVAKGPGHFAMGGHDPKDPDAWLIWWVEARTKKETRQIIRLMLLLMPYYKPRVCWARPLKGRTELKYYSTDRLIGFTKRVT